MPGAGSGGGPWSHGGGLLPRPYTPSFPPSLSPQSSASSITARGGQVPDGQGRFPRAPRRASPPRPDSGTGRHLGASPVWLQVPGPAGQERGQGPGCTSGPWGLQAQPGRSWKEAGQLVSGPGFCPGPPEGQHQQVREPSGAGSSDGVCGLPSTRGYAPGAGRQLTLSHAQTNARCPARPAPPSGSAGAGFPTAAAHGQPSPAPRLVPGDAPEAGAKQGREGVGAAVPEPLRSRKRRPWYPLSQDSALGPPRVQARLPAVVLSVPRVLQGPQARVQPAPALQALPPGSSGWTLSALHL